MPWPIIALLGLAGGVLSALGYHRVAEHHRRIPRAQTPVKLLRRLDELSADAVTALDIRRQVDATLSRTHPDGRLNVSHVALEASMRAARGIDRAWLFLDGEGFKNYATEGDRLIALVKEQE